MHDLSHISILFDILLRKEYRSRVSRLCDLLHPHSVATRAIRGSASAKRNRMRCPPEEAVRGLSKNLARAADAVKVAYVSRALIRLPDKASHAPAPARR